MQHKLSFAFFCPVCGIPGSGRCLAGRQHLSCWCRLRASRCVYPWGHGRDVRGESGLPCSVAAVIGGDMKSPLASRSMKEGAEGAGKQLPLAPPHSVTFLCARSWENPDLGQQLLSSTVSTSRLYF